MNIRPELLPVLAAFESAARQQNFAHAGEELHLTASAVSHHVRELESRLGVTLFQRHARGVTLTAEDRQLTDAAGSALSDLNGVLRDLHDARDDHHRVRITALHSLIYTWLPPRLPALTAQHPQIRLVFERRTPHLQRQHRRPGGLDAWLGRGAGAGKDRQTLA